MIGVDDVVNEERERRKRNVPWTRVREIDRMSATGLARWCSDREFSQLSFALVPLPQQAEFGHLSLGLTTMTAVLVTVALGSATSTAG